jgi:PII-like signaling protein
LRGVSVRRETGIPMRFFVRGEHLQEEAKARKLQVLVCHATDRIVHHAAVEECSLLGDHCEVIGMKLEGDRVLLRIFLNTFQKWHHRPLYEAIVEKARKERMAGATAFIGVEGFGQNGVLLQEHPWRLANDREVIVEVVDTEEKTDSFLSAIEPMLQDAIVTREKVHAISYRRKGESTE